MPWLFLLYPVATSPSLALWLSGSVSPHLPSFLKFPNKSQQIDTYLPPPPSLSCPFSCSCLMWGEIINQTTACPLLFSLFLSTADAVWTLLIKNKVEISPLSCPICVSRNTGNTPPWCLCLEVCDWLIWGGWVCPQSTHSQVR